MPTVRYAGSGRYRVDTGDGYQTLTHGDTADVSAAQAEHLVDSGAFERLITAEPPVNPTTHSVSELEAVLEDGEFSASELEALARAEESGEDRKTAHEAIQTALDAVEQ